MQDYKFIPHPCCRPSVSKRYRVVLSEDKMYADVYLIGGDIKACFYVSIEQGKAVLHDNVNHSTVVIPTQTTVKSKSPFYYDETDCSLSVSFVLTDESEITFSSTINDLLHFDECNLEDKCHCNCDKPKNPIIDGFVTKGELLEEAKKRKRTDDRIFEILGVTHGECTSISSQIKSIEEALNGEIRRSKCRDAEHCEALASLNKDIAVLRHQTLATDKELHKLIHDEANLRTEGYNELFELIGEARKEVHSVSKRLTSLESMIRKEISDREDGDRLLDNKIEQERMEREDADRGLSQDIAAEETARIDGDRRLQDSIDAEKERALEAEETLRQSIEDEAASREQEDIALNARVDELSQSVEELSQNVDSRLTAIEDNINAMNGKIDSIQVVLGKLEESGILNMDKATVDTLLGLPKEMEDAKAEVQTVTESVVKVQGDIKTIKQDIVMPERIEFNLDGIEVVFEKDEKIVDSLIKTINAVIDAHDHIDGEAF